MTNNNKRRKKMSKVKTRTQENNFSVLQILGSLFLIFAVADFAVSWMGINLTPFMGSASRFSPIIFGVIGSVLLNMNKEDG
tara:strand:+ start:2482 stop:2724 length:243 start_codon:yes stop_codon:yes gene_type:complete